MNSRSRLGFTLIEVIVAVSVLAIVAGALVPRIVDHLAAQRDERRLSDLNAVQSAIERFHAAENRYPTACGNAAYGDWDVSSDGGMIPELVERGYLAEAPHDPLDDERSYYAYYVYEEDACGCTSDGPFYVLGIKAFESPGFGALHGSRFRCSSRDWSNEFAFVTGGGVLSEQVALRGKP